MLHPPGVLPAGSLCPTGLSVGNPPANSPPKEGPMGATPPDEPGEAARRLDASPMLASGSGEQHKYTFITKDLRQ